MIDRWINFFLHSFYLEKGNRRGIAKTKRSHKGKQKSKDSSDYSEALVYYILNTNYYDVYFMSIVYICISVNSHFVDTKLEGLDMYLVVYI